MRERLTWKAIVYKIKACQIIQSREITGQNEMFVALTSNFMQNNFQTSDWAVGRNCRFV